jgi:uncharacterized membrane protein
MLGESIFQMSKGRLEAFSDGVLAIIITITVLEMKVPHGAELATLAPTLPIFLSYVLSFVYVGIYWNNHHHLMAAADAVNAGIMWANLHLLFWLSLIPFVTGWLGENHFASLPAALYGSVLLMAAIAYWILQWRVLKSKRAESALRESFGSDVKGKISPVLYVVGVATAFEWPIVSFLIYVGVAVMWVIPDRRIERALAAERPK